MQKIKRYLPLAVIILLVIVVYATGVTHYLTFESLKKYYMSIQSYAEQHAVLTPFLFILIYIALTALSIPGAVFLSLLGGFIFSQPFSTLYVVFSATIGAALLFLAARFALRDFFKKKAGPTLKKMEKGFKENAVSYLLFLRFVPIFPFWLVNLAPAFFQVSLATFIWTTFVGIIPGSFVFTEAGSGIAEIFEKNESFSVSALFNTKVKIALIGLGIISLIPIVYKKIKKKKRS